MPKAPCTKPQRGDRYVTDDKKTQKDFLQMTKNDFAADYSNRIYEQGQTVGSCSDKAL